MEKHVFGALELFESLSDEFAVKKTTKAGFLAVVTDAGKLVSCAAAVGFRPPTRGFDVVN